MLTVDLGQGEGEMPGNIGDLLAGDDPGTPLRAFAADLSTPAALAARALAWHEHVHYGLWRIDDRVPAAGLPCIDIVSGTGRYVEFPTEATTGLPRWTVWLGGIVPVDGIWRSTGVGVRLSPTEADGAAESVDEAALAMLHALAGEPEAPPAPIPFGHAEPHGVYADDQEPVSAEMVSLMGKVAGAMITGIAADVHRYRASEKRIDPAMDFAWPVGQRTAQGGTAAAAEGWEKFWLDEKVPALFGRTPRQAARGRERPYLEAMLRQFEYEADLLAVDGKTGVDTAWLREQLDMPGDLAD